MIIYADVLIFVNIIVNYFLLSLSALINKQSCKIYRIISGAAVGGVFSLYILLPVNSTFIDIAVKLVCSCVMILITFGFKNIKIFLRNTVSLFVSSFIYAAIMLLIWQTFKINAVFVNNSTVYFNISVGLLIGVSVTVYIMATLIQYFLKRRQINSQTCIVEISVNGKTVYLTGFFDTGNGLIDNFSGNEVVLADKSKFIKKYGTDITEETAGFENRYRILPCKTVTGESVLHGFRADKMTVHIKNTQQDFINPVVVFSKTTLEGDEDALLNSEILTKMG